MSSRFPRIALVVVGAAIALGGQGAASSAGGGSGAVVEGQASSAWTRVIDDTASSDPVSFSGTVDDVGSAVYGSHDHILAWAGAVGPPTSYSGGGNNNTWIQTGLWNGTEPNSTTSFKGLYTEVEGAVSLPSCPSGATCTSVASSGYFWIGWAAYSNSTVYSLSVDHPSGDNYYAVINGHTSPTFDIPGIAGAASNHNRQVQYESEQYTSDSKCNKSAFNIGSVSPLTLGGSLVGPFTWGNVYGSIYQASPPSGSSFTLRGGRQS